MNKKKNTDENKSWNVPCPPTGQCTGIGVKEIGDDASGWNSWLRRDRRIEGKERLEKIEFGATIARLKISFPLDLSLFFFLQVVAAGGRYSLLR